jgi:hypothetical protein
VVFLVIGGGWRLSHATLWSVRGALTQCRRYTGEMNLLRVTVLGLACMLPAISFSQWQWVDNNGRKVFSDQSPPADIPAKNIIKQPGVKATAPPEPVAAAASQPAKPALPSPKLSGKDKQLEDKKKQAEAADAEKKKALEEQVAATQADNCQRAKRSKAMFDSGTRIARMNDKGEREYLDDAMRAKESKRLDGIIATDCKPAGAQ